jgi:sugar/nucleoside kinase (ribokinase family)
MKSEHLKFDTCNLRYKGAIGTGGIGTGKFFLLNGNHTLGREESRSGYFLDVRDYCKQHIIFHYIRTLLGPLFSVIPIGKLGDDDIGRILYEEMKCHGFNMKWIEKVPEVSTLFSFCFFYPDGSGGNLTTNDSASNRVDTDLIERAVCDIQLLGPEGLIIAVPEVPLEARKRLLKLGKRHGLFCSASFTTGEIQLAMDSGILKFVDLLAINLDEASAAAGNQAGKTGAVTIIKSCIKKLQYYNSDIKVAITAGKKGSWCWDGLRLNKFSAIKTKTVSTAGAGDAFFSGLLCGLSLGLHLFEAQQLASLVAGLSVTSPHTINKNIDRSSLNAFLLISNVTFSKSVIKLLEE